MGYGVGVRCVHRQARAVNCSPLPRLLSFIDALLGVCGGGEETGEGVAYQLHIHTIDMYH